MEDVCGTGAGELLPLPLLEVSSSIGRVGSWCREARDRPREEEPGASLSVESDGIVSFDIDRMWRSGEDGRFRFLPVGEVRDMVLFSSEQGNSQ